MATYKKFSELPEITEATESTKVPVLDGGTMKLLNGAKLGGSEIKTAIIKDSMYDDNLAGIAAAESAPTVTYECVNMTFAEAQQIVLNGGVLDAIVLNGISAGAPKQARSIKVVYDASISDFVIDFIFDVNTGEFITLYWTADGISTEAPSTESPR